MKDIVQRAIANSGRQSPVREAVRAELPQIVAALDAGASIRGIYRTYAADGVFLGKGPSSLTNALKDLSDEIAAFRASQRAGDVRSESELQPLDAVQGTEDTVSKENALYQRQQGQASTNEADEQPPRAEPSHDLAPSQTWRLEQ